MDKKHVNFQLIARSLLLPIALLPIAGLLLRFGQTDLLNITQFIIASDVIFSNLPLLFALGVAVGLSNENHGVAAIASFVAYSITKAVYLSIDATINTGVIGGILVGLIVSIIYNKYSKVKLPSYIAFFGGSRLVPILSGIAGVLLGFIFAGVWPSIQNVINHIAYFLLNSGGVGIFLYGVLNRFLLITGLHHILNNLVWFVFGDYTNTASQLVVHGDLARFLAGDKTAGRFMSGYFVIMIFGLPAAILAIYNNLASERKKLLSGILLSMALTSLLTGVTEPIEFAFVFVAPLLFIYHSVLTGLALVLCYYLNIHLGFTFSAGLIDYILYFKLATNPLLLIPIGLIFAVLYYYLFSFFIKKYNLQLLSDTQQNINQTLTETKNNITNTGNLKSNIIQNEEEKIATKYIEALGGIDNILTLDYCTTRLRIETKDTTLINKQQLQSLGVIATIVLNKHSVQLVIGTTVDLLANSLTIYLKSRTNNNHTTVIKDSINSINIIDNSANIDCNNLIRLLGDKMNIKDILLVSYNRLRVEIITMNIINYGMIREELLLIISKVLNINTSELKIRILDFENYQNNNTHILHIYFYDLDYKLIENIYNKITQQLKY